VLYVVDGAIISTEALRAEDLADYGRGFDCRCPRARPV
jgi:hypothetical protein